MGAPRAPNQSQIWATRAKFGQAPQFSVLPPSCRTGGPHAASRSRGVPRGCAKGNTALEGGREGRRLKPTLSPPPNQAIARLLPRQWSSPLRTVDVTGRPARAVHLERLVRGWPGPRSRAVRAPQLRRARHAAHFHTCARPTLLGPGLVGSHTAEAESRPLPPQCMRYKHNLEVSSPGAGAASDECLRVWLCPPPPVARGSASPRRLVSRVAGTAARPAD